MSTTAINVKFVDNELYIIAIPSNGMASIELSTTSQVSTTL